MYQYKKKEDLTKIQHKKANFNKIDEQILYSEVFFFGGGQEKRNLLI